MIMAIDPALKGTTFGAALEAAERAEQAKREAREAERANPQVIPHARQLAQELRQQLNASNPTKEPTSSAQSVNGPDHHAKRADWVRMAQSPDPSPDLTDLNFDEDTPMTDTPKIMTMRDLLEVLSDDAWQKPPQGIDPAVRAVAKSKGWIEATGQTSGQRWHITPEGFEELERLRTGAPRVNNETFRVLDGGINLDDPALRPDDTASEHLKTIENLNQTLDGLEFELDMFRKAEAAIKPMMAEDSLGDTLVEYVAALRQGLANETAIVDDINAMAAADSKGHMDPRDYVAELRAILQNTAAAGTPHSLGVYQDIIDAIQKMLEEDGSQLTLVDYVAALRAHPTTTGINWYELVIAPLIDLIALYDGDDARLRVESDPTLIVRGVSMLRTSLSKVDNIAEKREKLLEQKDAQIESLNRCIEQLRENLNARVGSAQGYSALMLSETILDELCDMIAEVGEYRLAREQAVKAISTLKARRS